MKEKFRVYYSIDIEAEDILVAEEQAHKLIIDLPKELRESLEVTVRGI